MSEATSSAAAPTGDGGAAANGPENGTVAAASNEVASGTQGMQASIPAAPEMKQTLGESKAQADARRKFKFKVDGAEVEEELSDTDVHVRLQKAMAVEKRFQEVANQRKQIEEALKTIKSDPAKALKELAGIDLDEWAEQRLTERYQEAMMPEEQRELAALKKKIADYEAREEEAKAAAQRTQYEAFEQQVYEQTQQEFIKAVDILGYDKEFSRTVVLPIMAEIAEAALDYGVDLTPEQLAHEANKRLETVHQRQIKSMSGDSLLKYLGDDVVKQIIRSKLGATKSAPPVVPAPPAREPRPSQNKPKSLADFRMKHLYGVE